MTSKETAPTLSTEIEARFRAVRQAARGLRSLSSEKKNQALLRIEALLAEKSDEILAANARDLAALPADQPAAFRDRLHLNEKRIAGMRESLRQIAALPDPVGEVAETQTLKNGLEVRRVRSPLGVIFMIFESRPNVAMEAFSLAFKAGNAIALRGGKESRESVDVLSRIIALGLSEAGVDPGCVYAITDPDRAIVAALLERADLIDVVVPRGGDGLIQYVTRNSRIPVIKNDRGMCHVFVHEDADLVMAKRIVVNAKTQRPGVCNAMETLLVHERAAPRFLPLLHAAMPGVRWLGCGKTLALIGHESGVERATPESFDTEHLDLVMNCRVVPDLDEAIAHIERHGSRHSESIVTSNELDARRFQGEVDAAAVYWNASTRFTDGFELGLGGELGISTQKLHVRGPVGLRELTSLRWIMDGKGQVRE